MTPDAVAEIRAEIAALPRQYTPELRALRKRWSKRLEAELAAHVIAIAQAFERAAPQERKWMAYELIRHHAAAFEAVDEAVLEDFAGRIESWYATDAFGTILSGAAWTAGRPSGAEVDRWSRSEDKWRRRTALTTSVGRNAARPDPDTTFDLCLRLAADRDDMIEKAVSWALRYLSQKDKAAVAAFMAEHGDKFRPRVRREVRNKLATGLKTTRGRR